MPVARAVALTIAICAPYALTTAALIKPSLFYPHVIYDAMRHSIFISIMVGTLLAASIPVVYSTVSREWQSWGGWGPPQFNRATWLLVLLFFFVALMPIVALRRLPADELRTVVAMHFTPILISSSLLVAIVEEAIGRGFILGSLVERMAFLPANGIQAFLFACAHIGRYSYLHFDMQVFVKAEGAVFLAALIWGGLRRTSGSLWLPIAFHCVFDLL